MNEFPSFFVSSSIGFCSCLFGTSLVAVLMSAQITSGQTYKITNVKSGTVVDLSGVDNHTSTPCS